MGCSSSVAVSSSLQRNGPLQLPIEVVDDVKGSCILSEHQKTNILQTWKLANHSKENMGQKIFLTIFRKSPLIQSIFHLDTLTESELILDTRFQNHSSRFIQIIESAVHSLDNLDIVMSPVMRNLGRLHIRKGGFTPEYLDLFIASIMETLIEELQGDMSDEAEESWYDMLNMLVSKMKDGYELGSNVMDKSMDGSVTSDTYMSDLEVKSDL